MNNLPHGNGVLESTDYEYKGFFKDGKPWLFGSISKNPNDQDFYWGTYTEDFVKNGIGVHKLGKTKHYEGGFLNDKFHGYGKIIWSKNNSYEGQWVNGVKEGKGQLKLKGATYYGDFKEDQFHGEGTYIPKTGHPYKG